MIESVEKLEEKLKFELEDGITPYVEVMELYESIGNIENMTLGDLLDLLKKTNALLTPLESRIQRYKLNLKFLTIELKKSEEYAEYKTIKAKDEQAVIDTSIANELLLELKDYSNSLRSVHEFVCYALDQSFGLDEEE